MHHEFRLKRVAEMECTAAGRTTSQTDRLQVAARQLELLHQPMRPTIPRFVFGMEEPLFKHGHEATRSSKAAVIRDDVQRALFPQRSGRGILPCWNFDCFR